MHQAITAYLSQLAASEVLKGVETASAVIDGQPAEVLLDTVQTQQADLLVLWSHGSTGVTRWPLGSVAQKVARHSSVPVLILRDDTRGLVNEQPQAPSSRPIRVMVALAECALQPAVQLSTALSVPSPAALHLVRVVPFTTDFEYGQEDAVAQARRQAMQEAQMYLHQVQKRLREENPDIHVMASLAMSTDIAETLLTIAETGEGEGLPARTSASDLIALATHGRSGPARRVMGSIAERMLGATRLPLLIVRAVPRPGAES